MTRLRSSRKSIFRKPINGASIASPYALDAKSLPDFNMASSTVFFDGVFKGDYSLAIVNRYLARSLIRQGIDISLYSSEEGWSTDRMLNEMPDVRARCTWSYPAHKSFDIHLRNTWPPKADDMVGRRLNAYVCFAWEELKVPKHIVDHFNIHLDLIMVTANFVEKSLKHSGVTVPVAVVGNGTDHIVEISRSAIASPKATSPVRVLHVSSCFPRKGADQLVKAFTESFSDSENIELCIKTFDNPHNTIEQEVESARRQRPRAAPIKIIKQSMEYPELVALMQSSALLVAPSRGEGFGLPIAEAMLLDVPVVTTGYSGQTDFCTDDTAWLIDYRLAPSTSHVATEGAVWAEPLVASLGSQMRRALSDPRESRAKLAQAKALLNAHFKWSDVARRVCHAIGETLGTRSTARSAAPAIQIDLVSTWEQVCGIATYSKHMFANTPLQATLTNVFARKLRNDELPSDSGPIVSRPWGYDNQGIRHLSQALSISRSDVIWFQHHPGFFSYDDMVVLSAALGRSDYLLKAITLHNVRETITNRPTNWIKQFDTIIVHTQTDADLLMARGVAAVVIPHGILAHEAQPRQTTGTFTVGTFGFLYPHKNIPLLLESFALAKVVQPRLRLKLLNCVRNDPLSYKELVRVEGLARALGIEDALETAFNFLSDDEIIERLEECDLLCFPYGESSESATGAVRIALAANRPLLCSQSSVLSDVLPLALVLTRVDARCLADALITLSASPIICGLRDQQRQTYVERRTYPIVAQTHLNLFLSRLGGKQ